MSGTLTRNQLHLNKINIKMRLSQLVMEYKITLSYYRSRFGKRFVIDSNLTKLGIHLTDSSLHSETHQIWLT